MLCLLWFYTIFTQDSKNFKYYDKNNQNQENKLINILIVWKKRITQIKARYMGMYWLDKLIPCNKCIRRI